MLFNLEAQERMDCREGLLISRGDDDTTPRRSLLEAVLHLLAWPFHICHFWGHSVVHKHRNVEIPVLKSLRDVCKVLANVVALCRVCEVG